jgi:hypothetical protein
MALADNRNPNLETASDAELFDNAFSWEPKKKHQFILYLGKSEIPSYLVKTSDKPSIDNGEVTIDHMNIQRYIKGKSKWNTIALSLYDPIDPSAARQTMDWIRRHHESQYGRDGYGRDYKEELKLHQLDGYGDVVEEWILKNAWVKDAKFGGYDASSEDIQMVDLTIRYDWAFFNY